MMLISASTNPPKLEDLHEYIERLNDTDVDYIHCDVMDGEFVTAKTFSHKTVIEIKKQTTKPLDVHLMTLSPEKIYKKYIKAGANILTVHFEVFKNKDKLIKVLSNIRKKGCFAGLSFKPETPVADILPLIPFCDLLLVMSVTPGKSGQEFLLQTYERLAKINAYLKCQKLEIVIEVDGGVNSENIVKLKEKNVKMVVMGNFLFSSKNLEKTVKDLKSM
ncbi:MAG: ribulose-phosphate 3-epimerase [Clostridia bacterium]|nr:ribulose-phosphate 3-epimerase [Clostridia bacterium]